MNTGVDHFTARAQLAVTILWILCVFGVIILDGLGRFSKPPPIEGLIAATGVVLYFWFNRQRNQDDPKAASTKENMNATQSP